MKLIFKILITFLLISAIWLCFSCGARKVNKDKYEEKTKIETIINSESKKESENNVKVTETFKTDDKTQTVIKETTYEPQDNSKESSITESDGKKTILNNTKKTVKETIQNNNIVSNKALNSVSQTKEKAEEKKGEVKTEEKSVKKEIKNIEQKAFNWFSLWWLYAIIIGLLYFFRKSIPILKLIP